MQNSIRIQYIVLVILFLIAFYCIWQLRTKVASLEATNKATGAAGISAIQASATTALSTAKTANDTADTALSTAQAISSTASTALTNSNTALDTASSANTTATNALSKANGAGSTADSVSSTANTALTNANAAKASQASFAAGFTTVRVIPTFSTGPSLASVSSIDSAGGYLQFDPMPSGKMSFQLLINVASGHVNDTNLYFDINTPYKCTLLNDWVFYASSTLEDAELDEVIQVKVSQISPNTSRVRFLGNGYAVVYARLTISGNWTL
ncbi:MAG: hypothetical protein EOP45_21955 [Sphingobacteriaceae bacterium]|nr:MAG: hypothetical protein EOP45_21955 [Sphingobacteriaceae bacterium]